MGAASVRKASLLGDEIQECARGYDADALVLFHVEQVRVSRDNEAGTAFHRCGDVLIVVRVFADVLHFRLLSRAKVGGAGNPFPVLHERSPLCADHGISRASSDRQRGLGALQDPITPHPAAEPCLLCNFDVRRPHIRHAVHNSTAVRVGGPIRCSRPRKELTC